MSEATAIDLVASRAILVVEVDEDVKPADLTPHGVVGQGLNDYPRIFRSL